ncbi:MAG: tRNA (adenosine(37)-N6)-threonylcarbamoyltransferase complex ATPase subunit type 1 TsaE [Myxococcales bacterium]|nr:tRNA (adenosine(37)-N6)-threonylcarbamoyltransferase complex ATPase subunit type 1 TsaE [Myxococcales bacterium]
MSGVHVHTATPDETQALAARLALALAERGAGVVVGLLGGLGAGKTTFVQGFVRVLPGGQDLYVTSPTYALAQTYPTQPPVTHMDLYRLGSLDDLEMIGYRDLYFGGGITLVEWIDRVPEALPRERVEVRLSESPDGGRDVRVEGFGAGLDEWVKKACG